jgi:uncharacterized protein YdaU (DUF1376 family)
MAKDNFYFPFYYKDWLIGTKGMTDAERGVYIHLICYDFDLGGLPDDDKKLLALAEYSGRKPALMLQFIRTRFTRLNQDGKIVLRNSKVLKVVQDMAISQAKRRKGAEITNEKLAERRNAERTLSEQTANAKKRKEKKIENKVYIKEEEYIAMLTPLAFTPNFKNELVKHFRCIKTKNKLTKDAALTLIENIKDYVMNYGETEVLKKVKESIVAGYPNVYEPKIQNGQKQEQPQIYKPTIFLGED